MDIKEQIIDLQGQIDELSRKLKEKQEVSVPQIKMLTDIKRYHILRVDNLYAGLPIYDTSTTTNHIQGEIYITKIGTTSGLCAFIDGAEKRVELT